MHFHLPKPLHGWREFTGEVGIIVIGVLIALGAEQAVETVQWHHKVETAKAGIEDELNLQLDYSEEVVRLNACMNPFVDALEHAILRHDSGAIQRIYAGQAPFKPRPWRSTAWQSAMSTQVADHFDPSELSHFAMMFSSFDDIHSLQNSVLRDFTDATSGRLNGPFDPATVNLQLSAAERLRTQLALQSVIAETMIGMEAGNNDVHHVLFQRHQKSYLRTFIPKEANDCAKDVRAAAANSRRN